MSNLKKILLTGSTGYIGKRILPVLLETHKVVCSVRDKSRFSSRFIDHPNCEVIEVDFLKEEDLKAIL